LISQSVHSVSHSRSQSDSTVSRSINTTSSSVHSASHSRSRSDSTNSRSRSLSDSHNVINIVAIPPTLPVIYGSQQIVGTVISPIAPSSGKIIASVMDLLNCNDPDEKLSWLDYQIQIPYITLIFNSCMVLCISFIRKYKRAISMLIMYYGMNVVRDSIIFMMFFSRYENIIALIVSFVAMGHFVYHNTADNCIIADFSVTLATSILSAFRFQSTCMPFVWIIVIINCGLLIGSFIKQCIHSYVFKCVIQTFITVIAIFNIGIASYASLLLIVVGLIEYYEYRKKHTNLSQLDMNLIQLETESECTIEMNSVESNGQTDLVNIDDDLL
jgi:hypothetical protein